MKSELQIFVHYINSTITGNLCEKHSEACNIKDFAVYESPLGRWHQFSSPA